MLSIAVTFCYCLIFCLSIFDVFVYLHSFFVCYVIVEGVLSFQYCYVLFLSDFVSVYS